MTRRYPSALPFKKVRADPEEAWQRDVLRLASANGWKYTIEDCQPSLLDDPKSSALYVWFAKKLQRVTTFLMGQKRQEFNLAYHTYDSRKSTPGFPDLVLVHPRRKIVIFAELKIDTTYPSNEQRLWLAALTEVAWALGTDKAHHLRVRVWKPKDRAAVVQELGGVDV